MRIVGGYDIETTGLEIGDHRIIEACLQLWDLKSRKRLVNVTQRIDPQRSIVTSAQAVHGISLADLSGCPTWETVGPKLRQIMERCDLIVAHHGEGFDFPFTNHELKRIGLPPIPAPTFDTMKPARWATPVGKVPSLQELAWACEVPYDTCLAHAADYDVSVMMDCFFRGLDWGMFQLPEIGDVKVAA